MRKTFALLAAVVGATAVSIGVSHAGESLVDPMDSQRDCCTEAQIEPGGPLSRTPGNQLDATAPPIAPRFPGPALNPRPRPSAVHTPSQTELDAEPLVPDFNEKTAR